MIRLAYVCAYAVLAALGEALVARPALFWVRSQGLFQPCLAWEVPYGALLLACAVAIAVFTLWLASQAALHRRPHAGTHVAFLLLVGICFSLRSASGNPRAPADPSSALLDALRVTADELDRGYTERYTPDAAQFTSCLAQVRPPPFYRLGRQIPLHVRVLSAADGSQIEPLPGDQPGTIYVAVAKDRRSAWVTALTLDGILILSGKPALIAAHAGTHSAPGGDPVQPAYQPLRSGK
jgi:hypothetical protein